MDGSKNNLCRLRIILQGVEKKFAMIKFLIQQVIRRFHCKDKLKLQMDYSYNRSIQLLPGIMGL